MRIQDGPERHGQILCGSWVPVNRGHKCWTSVVRPALTSTVKAQDLGLPANELTYSLEPGAPSGVAIDARTGVFSWPPGSAGTNSLTVKVTDGRLPPLSHTTTVTVVATAPEGPKLLGSFLPNGQFQLTPTARSGEST
ncbi:MAG: putative Ig domain-containing protein [Verrucomicrobia bacterium]|nr:putative Ig domain-containing protein [Verrucomicrobiota bacterium]